MAALLYSLILVPRRFEAEMKIERIIQAGQAARVPGKDAEYDQDESSTSGTKFPPLADFMRYLEQSAEAAGKNVVQ